MDKEYIEREALNNNLHSTKQVLFFCAGNTSYKMNTTTPTI